MNSKPPAPRPRPRFCADAILYTGRIPPCSNRFPMRWLMGVRITVVAQCFKTFKNIENAFSFFEIFSIRMLEGTFHRGAARYAVTNIAVMLARASRIVWLDSS